MQRHFFILLLSLGVLFTLTVPAQATYDSGITYGPYIQRVTKKAASILITTDEASQLTLRYKKVGGKWKSVTESSAITTHRFRISNLKNGTQYQYYLLNNGTRLSQTYTFSTHRKDVTEDEPLHVAAVGDSGLPTNDAFQVAMQIRRAHPDIIVHTGDIAYYSGTQTEWETNFSPVYGPLLAEIPFYGSIGNHDYVTNDGGPYKEIFETPTNSGNEDYYSFNYDNVHFVALNTELDYTEDSDMYNWVQQDLANSNKRWKIVFFHKPPFSSGSYGDIPAMQASIVQLFEEHGVDLVLNGHEHMYERTKEIGGVHYVITGGGGHTTLYSQLNDDTNTEVYEAAYHYTDLEITPDEITGKAIDGQGYIFDTFTITP